MDENQKFQDYLKENFGLSSEDLLIIQTKFEQENFKKNEIILQAGEICKKLYFVKKGILRTFHINQNGTEFTRLFAEENKFCTVLISFSAEIPSAANIQALEDTEVFFLSLSNFREVLAQSSSAKNAYTNLLEEFQNFQISRLEDLTMLSPAEKMQKFLKENRKLEQRLTDKVIATYLQITPETYSRSKKKLLS